MSRKLRRFIAFAVGLMGLGALAYNYYALMLLGAVGHTFEALHLSPVETSLTLVGQMLPYIGWLLFAVSALIFAGPEIRRRFLRRT